MLARLLARLLLVGRLIALALVGLSLIARRGFGGFFLAGLLRAVAGFARGLVVGILLARLFVV